jgi:threonine aldolase
VHPVQANSVFVKFPKAWTGRLRDHTFFYIWDEQEWVARLMCSFDTQPATLDALADLMLTLAESSPPQ